MAQVSLQRHVRVEAHWEEGDRVGVEGCCDEGVLGQTIYNEGVQVRVEGCRDEGVLDQGWGAHSGERRCGGVVALASATWMARRPTPQQWIRQHSAGREVELLWLIALSTSRVANRYLRTKDM